MVGGGLWLRSQVGYDAMVTLCQQRGLSAAEIFSLTTFVVGYLVFDMFVILAEDDMLEAVSYMFGGVICAALVLLALAVDVQYYFMISAISGGEATLRIFYTDIVNNGLCLLRVFFC
jgi:phage-related holin